MAQPSQVRGAVPTGCPSPRHQLQAQVLPATRTLTRRQMWWWSPTTAAQIQSSPRVTARIQGSAILRAKILLYKEYKSVPAAQLALSSGCAHPPSTRWCVTSQKLSSLRVQHLRWDALPQALLPMSPSPSPASLSSPEDRLMAPGSGPQLSHHTVVFLAVTSLSISL